MTILSPETLLNFLDLIEDGETIGAASAACGAKPKSKIAFVWLKASEALADFETPPDPESVYCVTRGGNPPEWFHDAYRRAVAAARSIRSERPSPMRRELESQLAAKRADPSRMRADPSPLRQELEARLQAKLAGQVAPVEPSMAERQATPERIVAHRARQIEGSHGENGPPSAGRFLMTADKPKSFQERRAGTVEITDTGIRRW